MAYVCAFNSSKKKVVGDTVGGIRADIRKRFPDLQNVDFSMRYFDEDVKEFLDFDDEMLPPSGATLRIGYELLAAETESVAVDSEETQFPLPAVAESSSSTE